MAKQMKGCAAVRIQRVGSLFAAPACTTALGNVFGRTRTPMGLSQSRPVPDISKSWASNMLASQAIHRHVIR